MQLNILNKENKATGKVALPTQFKEEVRPDLIKRAVLVLQNDARQPYGTDPSAGKRSSARVSKRRHDYKTTYGIGQSRTPRKVMSYRGTRFNWTGAFAPQTVGGRRAHPPKADKVWEQKINTKERKKAIRSALAATMDKELVAARGHKVPEHYPFIIDNEFETISKTKEVKEALLKLGLAADLARAETRKVRAGKGTMRGRKYKQAVSVLIVTGAACELSKAAENVPGVDIITAKELNAEYLAPGTVPGRLTLYTEAAIKAIAEHNLFSEGKAVKKVAVAKEEKKVAVKAPVKKAVKKVAVAKKTAKKAEVSA
jgi:large subunit ribosomal protein L4e